MKAIRKTALRMPVAILALSLFAGLPAYAQDAAAGKATAASTTAQKMGAVADAMALAVKRKKQAVRNVGAQAPRLASLLNQNWGCSGVWCGRQYVLMLGIGY